MPPQPPKFGGRKIDWKSPELGDLGGKIKSRFVKNNFSNVLLLTNYKNAFTQRSPTSQS